MVEASARTLNETSIRLLGPVDAVVGGRPVAIAGRPARTMLAALAVRAGQVLSSDTLIEAVWGDGAPRTAAHSLHVHASSLRKLLPGLSIIARSGGYALQAGPGVLDTDRFEELAALGGAELSSGRPDAATAHLRDALGLWRGEPLADVEWQRFAEADVQRWESLRHMAQERLIDAAFAAGRHAEMVAEIEALVREQPFREHRWGQLMTALYATGRQAEALKTFHRVRVLLAEELGIEPSPVLRELEASILRQDASLPHRAVEPVTLFARGPAGRLAYQKLGDATESLVFIPGFGGNLEIRWEDPNLSRLYRRLARSKRLVLLDKRGTGLSDRDTGMPPAEQQVDDVIAVMDAAGIRTAALLGVMDGGAIALLTAARYPERVDAVVTYACFAAYDLLGPAADALFDGLRRQLDHGVLFEETLPLMAPSRTGDLAFSRWFGRYMRMAAGVGGAAALLDRFQQLDIRATLPRVHARVLAIHRQGDRMIPAANATYLAGHVPDGRAVVLPGDDSVIWAGDVDAVAAEIEGFLRPGG